MKKQRSKFTKAFKLKVILEALKERSTVKEVCQKVGLHPNQISNWKQEYVYINPPNGGMMLYDGIEEYMRFYNYERDHQTLDYLTPAEVYYDKKVQFQSTKYLTTLV